MTTFTAKDSAGREVNLYVHDVRDGDASPAGSADSAQLRIRDADGQHVHCRGKGQYETLAGAVLTSDDPDAP